MEFWIVLGVFFVPLITIVLIAVVRNALKGKRSGE
jgi:hypothetical protein